MPSCLQSDSIDECGDVSSIDEDSFKCGKKKPCDCSKIVGKDHLKEKRARKFKCRSKRIRNLAEPKWVTPKCCGEQLPAKGPAIEVIKLEVEQTPVRIKMLSYPKVQKLVASRNAYKQIVDKQWFDRLGTYIQKSMLTMHSRLGNCQLPGAAQTQKKWTKADWTRNCEWMKKRALPKKIKRPPVVKRKRVPIESLLVSIDNLSKPRNPAKKYRFRCGYVPAVTEAAQLYTPTERILKLALPKNPVVIDEDMDEIIAPFSVNPRALEYQPTDRVKMLAQAKVAPKIPTDDAEITEFGVLKRALKASVSQRILDLAKPKEKGEDDEDQEERPLVNPKALKAKPTPRILQLAQPRNPVQKVKN